MTSVAVQQRSRRKLRLKRSPPPSIRPAMPRPQRRDCHGRLIALILEAGGPGCSLVEASFRPWCSATFIGAQHRICLRVEDEQVLARGRALACGLVEAELTISGHIVADLAVDWIEQRAPDTAEIMIAALTVEDW